MSGDKKRIDRHGPGTPEGDDRPAGDLTGNGTVGKDEERDDTADGPADGTNLPPDAAPVSGGDSPAGPAGLGGLGGPAGAGAPSGSGGPGGPDSDADELRRMFQDAVGSLAPAEGTLDHLRRAVPKRRARKRQALIGVAAAALLLGTALPSVVQHLTGSGGGRDEARIPLGQVNPAEGSNGGSPVPGASATRNPAEPSKGPSTKPRDPDKGGDDGGQTPGRDPDDSGSNGGAVPVDPPTGRSGTGVQVCDASQLGVALEETGPPGADGAVYGTFRIANVSDSNCTVAGPGTISLEHAGAADPQKITVARHTSGDAAFGLPDPAQESAALMLAPDTSYDVRFAWVPSETCPTVGESPAPTPSEPPAPGEGSAGGTDVTGDGTLPQTISQDGGPQDGSVTVSLIPDSGAPAAQAVIPNACAGTVYQTGLLTSS
ncbi:hypothetical protein ABT354_06105 [Streptomyces sp. NPDC000594]|uniref:hypothetical protein n=1 Tax=Streptomyces sp. NPDC000594 TaxID=3154261 RepID=UPI00332AC6BC